MMNRETINTIIAFFWEHTLIVFLYQYNTAQKKGNIITSCSKSLSEGWEKLDEVFDKAISEIEESAGVTADSLIYVLASSFTDNLTGFIRKPYADNLKSLAKKLGLKPLGYICVKEIVARILENEEFIIPSGYVLEIDATTISMYTYMKGNMKFIGTTAKTDNIGDDILSIFSENKDVPLTSSLYICSEKEDTPYINGLSSVRWPDHIFVQLPKIHIISNDDLTSGMNEVIGRNLDSARLKSKEKEAVVTKTGFMVNTDINTVRKTEHQVVPVIRNKPNIQIPNIFKNLRLPSLRFGLNRGPVIAAVIALIILVLSFIFILFGHRAQVDLLYRSYEVKSDVSLNVTEDNPKKPDEIRLQKGTNVISVSGNRKTTGKQDRGEKAKGNIILHNWENQAINLPKGEKITMTASNLVFELDADTQVPAAKEITLGTKETGKVKAGATASAIGTEYNIAKDVKGSVGGRSQNTIFAVTDSSFSGGTKKTVATISKADLETIDIQATESALIEFKKQQKENEKNEVVYIYDLFETDIIASTPSGEVGEEAVNLSYKADVKISEVSLSVKDLRETILQLLEKNIKKGEQIDENTLTYAIKKYDEEKDEVKITAQAKTLLSYDEKSLKKEIAGKDIKTINTNITKILPVTEAKITVVPSFVPFFSKRTPFIVNNITIKIINRDK